MQNHYAPPRAVVADISKAGSGITDTMLTHLRATRPWTLLVAVVLIIFAVFMLLGTAGIILGGLAVSMGAKGVGESLAIFLVLGIVYGVGAVTYMLMGIYLAKYSSAISTVVMTGHAQDMTQALEQQRKFWKLAGIITLVMTVLTVIWIGALIVMPELMTGFKGMH
jgi:hypothetical protein